MYNPINKVLKAFEDGSRWKRLRPHPSVSVLEIAALLSFLPGMFIFLYAFVLSGAALLAALEIEKGNFVVAGLVYAAFGIFPGILGLVIAFAEPSEFARGAGLFVLYGGIGIFGIVAIFKQKRHIENAS